jgi:arginyl-tRNA synthetase
LINLVDDIKADIIGIVNQAVNSARERGQLEIDQVPDIQVEVPRERNHGDFSVNTAMTMVRLVKKPPREIAAILIKNMEYKDTFIEKVETAGPGFINFYLKKDWLWQVVPVILELTDRYGRVDIGKGARVQVEFVSANPTGPMHMGNARGAALGDSLASVLEAAGYQVDREFYINDAGNQIDKFGKSLEARYLQLLGHQAQVPEGGYQGQDIIDHARAIIDQEGDKYLDMPSDKRRKAFVEYALKKNIAKLKEDLAAFGVEFDVWFSEQSLYDNGDIQDTIDYLKDKGYTYEKDDALWFKASDFGADKDEVLVRNNGIPTYLAGDIAYHRNKFVVRGYDRVIDIWGADHHGHVARMKGSMRALGCDPDRLNIIIMQLVRLLRKGEVARMSKRQGQAITLADLIDEVGRDAARFFFNMRSADSHLDFDLDLAVEQSNDNPVFYVQYAHARICSILRQVEQDGIRLKDFKTIDYSCLTHETELELLRKLIEYPEEITIAAKTMEPSRITRYVLDLSSLFHSFYNSCRVKLEDEELMQARLALITSVRTVIKNVLDLLKIKAPDKM